MSVLIDWVAIDRQLAGIYAAAKGESAWPPLAFRALTGEAGHGKGAGNAGVLTEQIKMVAGTGFEPVTFRL